MPARSRALTTAVLVLSAHATSSAAQVTRTTAGCDSELELVANLQWVQDTCKQEGEHFAEFDTLVPRTVTTHGCADVVRRVARDCEGLLLRSPEWFAARKAALDAAIASAAGIPEHVNEVYHISDPNLSTLHFCGAVLDDGFDQFPIVSTGQSRIVIDVGPSRGNLRLYFEELTLDEKANDNLRLYADGDEAVGLRTIFPQDLPLADPILVPGGVVYILLVSDGASQRTSFRLNIGCVCEDSTSFVDADGAGCEAYAIVKHDRCMDLTTADGTARVNCPLACGACEVGPCDARPCQNGGNCTELEAEDPGHRRLQSTGAGDGHGYGSSTDCGAADLAVRSDVVNAECCDEPTEDCSSGAPATCNVGCSHVLVPYYHDCASALQSSQEGVALLETIEKTILLCDTSDSSVATEGRYHCTCSHAWTGDNCDQVQQCSADGGTIVPYFSDVTVYGSVDAGVTTYFCLQATQGVTYILWVTLGTLLDSVMDVYDSDRPPQTSLAHNDDYGGTPASHIEWTAPSTDFFYVGVRSHSASDTGDFTLDVAH